VIGAGDTRRASRARSEFMLFNWIVVTSIGATILLWNKSFVDLWVGPGRFAGPLSTFLVVVMAIQLVLIRNDAFLIDMTLHVRNKVLLGLLSAGLSLALAALLVGFADQGVRGVAVSFILGRAILSFAYPWLAGRAIGHPLTAQLRGAVRPILITTAVFAGAMAFGPRLVLDSWLEIILGGGLTAAAVALIAFVAGLTGHQRKRLIKRTRRMGRQLLGSRR
jgi:hypothetical protein